MAKGFVLDALKVNRKVRMHIVLGPGSKDAPRLKSMLRWTTRIAPSLRIHDQEMLTQDFLAVFEHDALAQGDWG